MTRTTRLIITGGVLLLVIIIVFSAARGCGSKKQATIQEKQATIQKPAASSKELAAVTRELRKISSQLKEINQRIPAEQVGAAVNALAEIRGTLERQLAVQPPPAPPQSRRERLSARELERRYKERLLQQEP